MGLGKGCQAEEGGLRREKHVPGRLILFLQLHWGCAVSQPGQGSTAELWGQPGPEALCCSLGRSALHNDLKHFGKGQNMQEKPTKLGLQLDTLVLSSVHP